MTLITLFFFAKMGSNFEKSKKVPLFISEIHAVFKFGLVRMKIAAGSLWEHHNNDGLVHYYMNILILPTLDTTITLTSPT